MSPDFLFGGSDNLFKYLFTVGAIMIVVSIIYPLQKNQEIEIAQTDLSKEVELLSSEIATLKKDFDGSKGEYENIISKLDSLTKIYGKNVGRNEYFIKFRESGNKIIEELKKRERELELKQIMIKGENSKIELLGKHSNEYKSYYLLLKWMGVVFVFIGLTGWSISTFITDIDQWKAYFKKKK